MINALLVLCSAGWFEVTDTGSISANGRKEAFLSLAPLEREAAEAAATYQLTIYSDPRTEITADIEPGDVEIPGIDFGLGDTIGMPDWDGDNSSEIVQSWGCTVDSNGKARFAVGVRDKLLDVRERHERAISKAYDGSFVGQTASANRTAVRQPERTTRRTPPNPVRISGYEEDIIARPVSALDAPDKLGTIKRARLILGDAATDDLSVEVRYNGTPLTNSPITVPMGDTEAAIDGDALAVTPDSNYEAELVDPGIATGWVTATVIIEHV